MVLVGTDGRGVFRSTDRGSSWTLIANDFQNFKDYDVETLNVLPGGDILAGTIGGGLFRSTNDGTTWTPVNTGQAGGVYFYCLQAGSILSSRKALLLK
jgi:photosystem II stability/assembly factor-like uncharacterized protein